VVISFGTSCDVPRYLLYPAWFFVSRLSIFLFQPPTPLDVRLQLRLQTQQDALLGDFIETLVGLSMLFDLGEETTTY
jgi:hypothetical protein